MDTIIALTAPQRELEAVDSLRRHGYDAWTPVEYRWRSIGAMRKRRKEVRPYPALPRYIFVGMPVSASLYHLRAIACQKTGYPVIAGYLERDGAPATLTTAEAIGLRKISTDAPPRSIPLNRGFSQGERVVIVEGPFKGWTTRVDRISRKRASCVLNFFGSTREIEFDLSQLEAA